MTLREAYQRLAAVPNEDHHPVRIEMEADAVNGMFREWWTIRTGPWGGPIVKNVSSLEEAVERAQQTMQAQ